MSGAPITVICYRNGIDSYGRWITDPTALTRVRELAAEGGRGLVEDVIWYEKEPWTKAVTQAWPAVDSFNVSLELDADRPSPPATALKRAAPSKRKR
jgi:hypothetical protein